LYIIHVYHLFSPGRIRSYVPIISSSQNIYREVPQFHRPSSFPSCHISVYASTSHLPVIRRRLSSKQSAPGNTSILFAKLDGGTGASYIKAVDLARVAEFSLIRFGAALDRRRGDLWEGGGECQDGEEREELELHFASYLRYQSWLFRIFTKVLLQSWGYGVRGKTGLCFRHISRICPSPYMPLADCIADLNIAALTQNRGDRHRDRGL